MSLWTTLTTRSPGTDTTGSADQPNAADRSAPADPPDPPDSSDAHGQRDERHDGDYCVLGEGALATAVAERLRAGGASVTEVGGAGSTVDDADTADPVDLSDTAVLDTVDIDADTTVIAATKSDARNLLLAQLACARFDVPRVVVLANTPDRIGPFADAGHEPVCATSALSAALVETL